MAYYRHICPYGLAKFVRYAISVWSVDPAGKTDEQIVEILKANMQHSGKSN